VDTPALAGKKRGWYSKVLVLTIITTGTDPCKQGARTIKVCFETLGCKVNQYETQAIAALLRERGHTIVAPGDGCDAIVVNTCAVTAESGRKSRQAVRRLRQIEPGAVVAVCGCFSQVSPEDIRALGVDIIAGSGDRAGLVDAVEKAVLKATEAKKGPPEEYLDNALSRRAFESLPAGGGLGRTRAMLKIQDGCSNFCTYCIIPYARGPSRSMPLEEAVREIKRLREEGYGEIVVTGIEISSYSDDIQGETLTGAVSALCRAAHPARVRLGSLEPRSVTSEFVEMARDNDNLCRHFHLSLQSGCDATLRRMKRRYTTAQFYEAVSRLREAFPHCGITADLIVGFPGETEEEFQETLGFIRRCAFSDMHIFPYSPRPGTPAASMPDQLDRKTKKRRAGIAGEVAREMKEAFLRSCVGLVTEVLLETEEGGVSSGHADFYAEVRVFSTGLSGTLRRVRITEAKEGALFGELL
jgi:threonylcarbamoyladenosine tRNA methylthiotransferase MtaB